VLHDILERKADVEVRLRPGALRTGGERGAGHEKHDLAAHGEILWIWSGQRAGRLRAITAARRFRVGFDP
jgi:hypothetical protein